MNFLPGFVTTDRIKLNKELFKNSRISYILTYSLSNGYSWRETPVLYFEENPGYNRTRKGIKIVWDLQPCAQRALVSHRETRHAHTITIYFMYIRSSKCERCTLVAFPVI